MGVSECFAGVKETIMSGEMRIYARLTAVGMVILMFMVRRPALQAPNLFEIRSLECGLLDANAALHRFATGSCVRLYRSSTLACSHDNDVLHHFSTSWCHRIAILL